MLPARVLELGTAPVWQHPASQPASKSMLCGQPFSDVEARLSASISASLRVHEPDRAFFISQHLLGEDVSALLPQVPLPKPDNFEAEVATLTGLVKAAVNSASRQGGSEPLHNIAEYLLLYCIEDEELLAYDEDQPVPTSIGTESTAPASTSALTGALATAGAGKAVAKQKPPPRNLAELKAAIGSLNKKKKTVRNSTTVLGKSASTVMPAVIGAFQEEAAKRAAQSIDEGVIAAAMAAGSGEAPSEPASPDTRAVAAAKR